MDQISVGLFLAIKGLSVIAIHRVLIDVLGSDAIPYSISAIYLRSASVSVKRAGSDERASDPGRNLTDDQILHALEISPFASVRQIDQTALFPKTTGHQHLMESPNFENKKLRWVPAASQRSRSVCALKNQMNCSKL
jgi:hypothetical protein